MRYVGHRYATKARHACGRTWLETLRSDASQFRMGAPERMRAQMRRRCGRCGVPAAPTPEPGLAGHGAARTSEVQMTTCHSRNTQRVPAPRVSVGRTPCAFDVLDGLLDAPSASTDRCDRSASLAAFCSRSISQHGTAALVADASSGTVEGKPVAACTTCAR